MFFKHPFEAKARQKSRTGMAVAGKCWGNSLRLLAEPGGGPVRNRSGEAVHEAPIDFEIQRRATQLLGIAHENAALAKQPKGGNRRLLLAGASGKKTPHQGGDAGEIRRSLLGHEAAEGRGRPYGFPVEDAQVPAEFVARGEGTQLALDE